MSWTRYGAAGNILKLWEKTSPSKPPMDMKALQKACEDTDKCVTKIISESL